METKDNGDNRRKVDRRYFLSRIKFSERRSTTYRRNEHDRRNDIDRRRQAAKIKFSDRRSDGNRRTDEKSFVNENFWHSDRQYPHKSEKKIRIPEPPTMFHFCIWTDRTWVSY